MSSNSFLYDQVTPQNMDAADKKHYLKSSNALMSCYLAPITLGTGGDAPTDVHIEVLMGYGEFNSEIWAKHTVMNVSIYDAASPWFKVFEGQGGILGIKLDNLRGNTKLKFLVCEYQQPANILNFGN